ARAGRAPRATRAAATPSGTAARPPCRAAHPSRRSCPRCRTRGSSAGSSHRSMRARCALPSGGVRATTNPLSAQLARRSQACESNGVSGALEPGGDIIMPPFMRGSCPFRIVIVVSLGGVLPAAAWAEEPPCPTRSGQPGTLAAASGGVAASSGAPRAPAPSGGGGIDLSSDRASFGADGKATLEGNVLVRQGEREIRADELQYDARDTSLSTAGHIDYRDPIVHVSGAGGSYSASAGADFKSAEFDLIQRAARGSAEDMRLTPQGVLRLRGVTFTTCPPRDSSWELKANTITLDTRDRIGTGRGARVDFKGVPLVYLPWVSFPLGSERKSGFLFPSIGNTSYGGLQLAVPYYWNIAPNADFTFQPVEYSRAGADLGGDLRFLTHSQRGEIDWNYLPYDGSFHGSRNRVRLTEVAELADDLRLTANAENVSDPFYFENFSLGPEGTSTAFVERRAALAWRATGYQLDHASPGQPRSPSRKLPVASFDTGLLFERESGSHAKRKLTLEPRVLYLEVPYRNQGQLPVFDTALPDFNPV